MASLAFENEDLGFGYDDALLAEHLGLPEASPPLVLDLVPVHEKLSPWPVRLPMELALNLQTEEELLFKYSLTLSQYETLKQSEAFRRELSAAQKVVRDEGLIFSKKCEMIAEDWLPELDGALHSNIPFAQKLDAFKIVTRLGRLEPKEEKGSGPANMVNIQINL